MKLRNKKTGEIIETDYELSVSLPDDEKFYGNNTYTEIKGYSSIKDLLEDWEDYEEPKEYWYIDYNGLVKCFQYLDYDWQEEMRAIGNYFESEEEAEKTVEKLKAYKRLKDKGISLKLDSFRSCIDYRIDLTPLKDEEIGNIAEDLELLFGEEEE